MRIHISIVVILVLVGYSCAEIISEISSASSDNGGALRYSSEDDIPVAARSAILVNDASDDFQKDKSLIIAVVNDYMDRVFENVHNFAIKSGLDPTPLQNLSQKFLTEHVTLKHGLLHGISTLKREKSVELKYSHDKKILTIEFPIVFSNLSFTYDYELQLLLVKHTGGMTGLIKDFTMEIVLQFDFNTYHAALLKSSVLKTGYYDDNLGNSYEGVENVLSQEVIIDDIGKDEEILTAIIDKYIDRLFGNVHRFAVAHGLDPIPLPDVNRTEILRAHVVLTNGTFNGVSTIGRENHVKLIYNHKTRVINVKFPIIFHDLSFRYHYDVGAMFAKEKGFFTGIMKNYKVTVDLNFDFKKYHLKMAKPLWVNGIVIVKFDKSPFAIIKTIIGSLVSAVLTPLINAILSGIFSKIGNKLVSTINDDLDRFLHRNSTNVANSINNLWELLLV